MIYSKPKQGQEANVDFRLRDSNIPHIKFFENHHSYLNLDTASDEELYSFGLANRPEQTRYPKLYAAWRKFLETKSVDVKFTATDIHHGPNREISEERNTISPYSSNWSGAVITSDSNIFKRPTTAVAGIAQLVRLEPNPTNDGPEASLMSAWIGIDGDGGSRDVAQCGIGYEMVNFTFKPYVWVEWFGDSGGDPELRVDLPFSQDDLVRLFLFVISDTQVKMRIVNLSSGSSTPMMLYTAPGSIKLTGNCVEWIVEKPTRLDNPKLAPYYGMIMQDCISILNDRPDALGGAPVAGPGYAHDGSSNLIRMVDSKGRTVSSGGIIIPCQPTRYGGQPASLGFSNCYLESELKVDDAGR